jgi:hypothetical protein
MSEPHSWYTQELETASGLVRRGGEAFDAFHARVQKSLDASSGTAVSRRVDERAAEIRKADDALTVEQSLAAAYRELGADELAALRDHNRGQALAKAGDGAIESSVPVAIAKAADEIQARRGSQLTPEGAIAQALREQPELADLWRQQ